MAEVRIYRNNSTIILTCALLLRMCNVRMRTLLCWLRGVEYIYIHLGIWGVINAKIDHLALCGKYAICSKMAILLCELCSSYNVVYYSLCSGSHIM